jgi:hypothetical protein
MYGRPTVHDPDFQPNVRIDGDSPGTQEFASLTLDLRLGDLA